MIMVVNTLPDYQKLRKFQVVIRIIYKAKVDLYIYKEVIESVG